MAILGILILTFLFYLPSISYYFVSDDFIVFFYHKYHPHLMRIDEYNNHYTPVIWSIYHQLSQVFGLNSTCIHLFTIFIHLLNVYLVYLLAKTIINNRIKNIVASLLFAFFFGAYEVVFWFGAINNSLMVTFYLIGIIFLIQYVRQRKIVSFILFQIGFVAAYFTHEYAISLLPTAVTYWWLFTDKKNKKEFAILFSLPIFIVVLSAILKAIIVKIPLVVRTPSLLKSIAFTLRSFIYLFVPNPYFVDAIPNFLIPLIFLIILIFLFRFTRSKKTLFLLMWTTFTIVIYSLTSAPQARYFYLSFIPVVIYIMTVVKLKEVIPIFYISFIIISGLIFLQNQKYYWHQSGEITKNVIGNIQKHYPKSQKIETAYFVNMPDSSNDSNWKAYVFRAGFQEMLTNIVHVYPKKIIFLRSFTPTPHTIEAPYIKPDRLKSLVKTNTIVFIYREDLKNVFLMK